MDSERWHVSVDQQRLEGTYTREEVLRILQKYPDRTVYVWQPGYSNWVPARQLWGKKISKPTPEHPGLSFMAILTLLAGMILLPLSIFLFFKRAIFLSLFGLIGTLITFVAALIALVQITRNPLQKRGTPFAIAGMGFTFLAFIFFTTQLLLPLIPKTSPSTAGPSPPEHKPQQSPSSQTTPVPSISPNAFHLNLPEGWETETPGQKDALLHARNPMRATYLVVYAISQEEASGMTLQDFVQATRQALMNSLENPHILDSARGKLNDLPADIAEIQGIRRQLCLDFYHLVIQDAIAFYQVVGWTSCELADENRKYLQDVLYSFTSTAGPPR